jgi:YegS/Rv2252/BmrU family lipid kinase
MTRCLVVVNPAAGRGRAADEVRRALQAASLDADVRPTQRPGDAVELAAAARREGFDLVVAAGGDGTVHEVVNGLLRDGIGEGVPALGVLPLGSGCDYAKTFDIPQEPARAAAVLANERAPRVVDVGQVVFRAERGPERRYFVNIAEVGIGAEVVARASTLPRMLKGAVYGVAFCLVLPRFRRRDATLTIDGERSESPLTNLVVAIGQVFGGGMRVAPHADPSDGAFDVQLQWGSKLDYVRGLPKVYKGRHIPHPRIREERAAEIKIDCEPAATLEADGEVLGHTPATLRILPSALRLKA